MINNFDEMAKKIGLSYFTTENTKELIKRREKLQSAKKMSYIFYLAAAIISIITFIPNRSSINEITIFVALIVLLIPFYLGSMLIDNAKKDFDKQKNQIIKHLNSDFCIHKSNCPCKEEYLKYMKNEEKINLLY